MRAELFSGDFRNISNRCINNHYNRNPLQTNQERISDKEIIVLPQKTTLCNVHNADNTSQVEQQVQLFVEAANSSKKFKGNFAIRSLFPIGQGAFGLVFRAVTIAKGPADNPNYPATLCSFLQKIMQTSKTQKDALIDSYRDSKCLDLVSIKVEILDSDDLENAVGKIHLIREFYILLKLFSGTDPRFSMVGFPLPIDFGYIGNAITQNLNKVIIYDAYGQQSSLRSTFFDDTKVFNLSPHDVTDMSYFAMELVGPNLDDWKEFFKSSRGKNDVMVFTPQTVLKLMDQLLCRLWVMHRKNIVHLDLKPDNVCMGIGRMCNTVYILDFGLSRFCSDHKPDITLGTRKYMSVGVMNMQAAGFTMDLESWFYVLLVLLCDDLPWSEQNLLKKFPELDSGEDREQKLFAKTFQSKKSFWGDEGLSEKETWHKTLKSVESHHKTSVPDIAQIVNEIYEHIRRMRNDFKKFSSERMHADIRNEDSDLSKRYHHLRKLLLYPYEFSFNSKDSCFINDKDFMRRQQDRRTKYQEMLVYCQDGRNWCWDWDEWFNEEYPIRK